MQQRANSLDALRGFAIITMVLSATVVAGILPPWMYHAQTPPPTHLYDPSISGLTWVDLVFPFFLFSMGAAFPLSIGRRLGGGESVWRLVGDTVLRWLQLAFFAIFIQHFYPYVVSQPQDMRSWLLALAAFALLFPMFMRYPRLPLWGRAAIKAAAYGAAVAMLLTTRYAGGRVFSLGFSNIIILILSNMALFGGLTYLFTADHRKLRIVIAVVVALLTLGGDVEGSWSSRIMGFSPVGWLLRFDYLRYLLILIPASFAGEWLVEAMKSGATELHSPRNNRSAIVLALLSVVAIVATLWSINHHKIGIAFIANTLYGIFAWLTMRRNDTPMALLWRRLLLLALMLMLFGLVAEPLQCGVKKDPATISYLLSTSALALYALIFLSIVCDYFGCRRSTAFLTMSGRNPMVAYVAGDLLLYPLFNLTGLSFVLGIFYSTPLLGFLHGVLLTSLCVLVTMASTKLKLYWRT
ncbi:MAG: DUF5009 domain-containing protein [Tidjanibacter sp.]|nr:DUF5009 domain-containing protein [Tidjanibacter sp.]